jgi:hypothetical protein
MSFYRYRCCRLHYFSFFIASSVLSCHYPSSPPQKSTWKVELQAHVAGRVLLVVVQNWLRWHSPVVALSLTHEHHILASSMKLQSFIYDAIDLSEYVSDVTSSD